MKYSVIIAGERLPGFPVLVQVFVSVFGEDRDTAAIRARHCRGILASGLDEAAAASAAEKCLALDVGVLTAPDELTAAPPARTTAGLSFGPGVLTWTGEAGTGAEPADGILALAAAPVKSETSRMVKSTEGPSGKERILRLGLMAAGVPVGMGRSKEVNKEVRGTELTFYLDMVLRTAKRRLRITPAHFDFSCLKEKKTYSGEVNFRLLCAELSAFAPAALKNAGLLAMLEGRPLGNLGYDGIGDLDRETGRLCALVYRP